MIREQHYMGRDGYFWWHGVVEDRQDPEKLGRLKVRVLGCHTKDKAFIKSEELQWAHPFVPTIYASMNGLGHSPQGPVPGTWVYGFYRDGEDMQDPVVLGTFGGVPKDAPEPSVGFNDPRDFETTEKLASAARKIKDRKYPKDGTGASLSNEPTAIAYPRRWHPLGCVIGEPDTNRIARGQSGTTVIEVMQKTPDDIIQGPWKDGVWKTTGMRDLKVPIAFEGKWDEPYPWFGGSAPYVHVYESESGHITVWDDTPGKEGSLFWDRSGTFRQVQTDGSEIHKVVFDGYTIVLKKNYIHIMNDQNERCDKEYNLSIGGRWNVEVFGNINIKGHKNLFLNVDGDANISAAGNVKVGAGADATVKAAGNVKVTAAGDVNIGAANAIKISCGSKVSITSAGAVHIKAGGSFAVDASAIHLNSGVASTSPASDAPDPIKPKQ